MTDKTQRLLNHAKAKNIISQHQFDALIGLNDDMFNYEVKTAIQQDNTPKFILSHLLYYFGGLIAIGAMTLFMTLGFDSYGSVGVMLISGLYAVFGAGVAYWLHKKICSRRIVSCLGFCCALCRYLCLPCRTVWGFGKTMTITEIITVGLACNG